MASDTPAADGAKKPPKKFGYVLVAVPGWPSQDPGRQMIYRMYPEPIKAERKSKRLAKRMPEYLWGHAAMTMAEAGKLKKKPFRVPGLDAIVHPTARGARVSSAS